MALLEKLCETYGPSGREDKIREIIINEIAKFKFEHRVDPLGNLICRIPPARSSPNTTKIMICSHMDEIGVIVTHVDKNGFLRFTNVGGVFADRTPYQYVIFENGTLGIIGVESKTDTPKPPRLDNMYIDIGAENKESALGKIQIGDIASFFRPASLLGERFSCKALDDRVGCYTMIEAMKIIKDNKDDLYFVFTVQEEVGLRGAKTGAFAIEPKYAIAVDITRTGDTPECLRMDVGLGKGTAIKIKDSYFIANPFVKDRLIHLAQESKVPFQLEILEHGTTDAAVVQLIKEGVRSGVISIPTRYIHTTCETCDMSDIDNTIKLLAAACNNGIE